MPCYFGPYASSHGVHVPALPQHCRSHLHPKIHDRGALFLARPNVGAIDFT